MADARIVWSELLCADEHEIIETLQVLDGIPQYAISVLSSYLQAGLLISNTLLNELDIDPCFWHQFDDDFEDEFDLTGTYNSDELCELANDSNYELVGDLISFDSFELHENYNDETVMRASSDSDLPLASNERASRSLSRTTVSNRVTRLARSHTPRQTNMPPPPAPKKGKAPLKGKAIKKTLHSDGAAPAEPLPLKFSDVSTADTNNPPSLCQHPSPYPIESTVLHQPSTPSHTVSDFPSFDVPAEVQLPVSVPQTLRVSPPLTTFTSVPNPAPQASSPSIDFMSRPLSPPVDIQFDQPPHTQRGTHSNPPIPQEVEANPSNSKLAPNIIFNALDQIPFIVRNEIDDKIPHILEDLTAQLTSQVATQMKTVTNQTQTLVANMKTNVKNDLSSSISRLVNSHIDGCKSKIKAMENSQLNLQKIVTTYSQSQDTFMQNHPIILDRLKADLAADLTSRCLETCTSQATLFQSKIDELTTKFNRLQTQMNSMCAQQFHAANPLPMALAQAHQNSSNSRNSNTPTLTAAPSGSSSVPQPSHHSVDAPNTLADRLADLVNHKDRDDPPLFDGRESFSHFLSTFEDFVSDWNIPEEKWKHLLTKSLRKGFESDAGKSNHKLEIFLISTTMRHLTYDGLVAAAMKHFENENPNTYYNMLVTASQSSNESLAQWYNRVYSYYKDIIKFETTKGNEKERERIRLLAGSTFVSKLYDTGLRALLSSGENKDKTLEALYHKAQECWKALKEDRAATNRPRATVAMSQVVPSPLPVVDNPSLKPTIQPTSQPSPVAAVAPKDQEPASSAEGNEAAVLHIAQASKSDLPKPAPDNEKLLADLKNLLSNLVPSGVTQSLPNQQEPSRQADYRRDQRYSYPYDYYNQRPAYDQYYRYDDYYNNYYYNPSNYDNQYRDSRNRGRPGARSHRGSGQHTRARGSLNH